MVPSRIKILAPSQYDRSQREKELEDALIRAHAARISHLRKKQAKQVGKDQQELREREHEEEEDAAGEFQPRAQENPPESQELVLLLHGSSDPFNAFPVRITPEINRLIAYARDVVLPNILVPRYMKRLTLGAPKTVTYEHSNRVLGGASYVFIMDVFRNANEGAALAWLTSHIPAIVTLASAQATRDLSVEGLKMRLRSIRLLRQGLATYHEQPRDVKGSLRLHVRGLYESECMAGDTASARAHAAVLMQFEDPFGDDDLARAHDTMVLMFNSSELGCKTMQRTVIPYGEWTYSRLINFWNLCVPALPALPAADAVDDQLQLHPSVQHPVLVDIALRIRYCLSVAESPMSMRTPTEKLRGNLVYGWIVTRTFHDMGTLLNLYFDLDEDVVVVLGSTEGQRLTDACIALALLQCERKSLHEAYLDGTDIREASHAMLPRLAASLTRAWGVLTPAERMFYDEAYFWMAYVGAVFEQGEARKIGRPVPVPAKLGDGRRMGRQREKAHQRMRKDHQGEKNTLFQQDGRTETSPWYFSRMLAWHADRLHMCKWDDAKRVLERFVYDRHLQPEGHVWFEEALRWDYDD